MSQYLTSFYRQAMLLNITLLTPLLASYVLLVVCSGGMVEDPLLRYLLVARLV